MAKKDNVQDERYVLVPWMAKKDNVQNGLSRYSAFQGISASLYVKVCLGAIDYKKDNIENRMAL